MLTFVALPPGWVNVFFNDGELSYSQCVGVGDDDDETMYVTAELTDVRRLPGYLGTVYDYGMFERVGSDRLRMMVSGTDGAS